MSQEESSSGDAGGQVCDGNPTTGASRSGASGGKSRLSTQARKTRTLALIAEGRSIVSIARELKISPRTIFRWLDKDSVFKKSVNDWRDETTLSIANRTLAFGEAAVSVVGRAIVEGDKELAMKFLKAMRLGQPPRNALEEDTIVFMPDLAFPGLHKPKPESSKPEKSASHAPQEAWGGEPAANGPDEPREQELIE